MIITNKFTTNYDIYTDAVIGSSAYPSLVFDFAKSRRNDLRLVTSRTGVSTVFDSSGFITSVPENTARIDTNPYTGECMGLLTENSSTNVIQNAFLGSWSSTGTALAPDRSTAYKAVPVGSVTYPGVGNSGAQNFNISSLQIGESQDFSFSAYFAPWGSPSYRPFIVIGAGGTSLTTLYALLSFNPGTGTFASKSFNTAFTEIIPNTVKLHPCGMYYVTWTVRFTQPSSYSSVGCYLQILNDSNVAVYTANGTSGFQYACMQFEQSSEPTSYIPTTLSSVTRNRDQVLYPISDSWFNPLEGSAIVDYSYGNNPSSTRVFSLESSGSNYIALLGSNSGLTAGPYLSVQDNTSPQSTLIPTQPVANSRNNVIISYKENDFKICKDGGNVLQDTAGTVPQGLTNLRFSTLGGGGYPVKYISKFAYFPKALSSEEMSILTIK